MCVENEKPIFGQGNGYILPCQFWPLKPLILCDKKRLKCQHISLIILTISQIAVSIKIFVFHLNKRMTQLMAGGGVVLIGTSLIPLLSGLF